MLTSVKHSLLLLIICSSSLMENCCPPLFDCDPENIWQIELLDPVFMDSECFLVVSPASLLYRCCLAFVSMDRYVCDVHLGFAWTVFSGYYCKGYNLGCATWPNGLDITDNMVTGIFGEKG